MKKPILLISLLLTLQNVFAQCTEQNHFNVNWKFNEKNVSYEIKRKDEGEFVFYRDNQAYYAMNKGIKLDISINIPQNNYAVFMVKPDYIEDMNRIHKLFKGNNNQLSFYINSKAFNEAYVFPFEKKYFFTTKIIQESFNKKDIIQIFTRNNDIYGKHKINYYVILFHDEYGRKCSYFESPETEYDFGRKPLSLIWKDFWN